MADKVKVNVTPSATTTADVIRGQITSTTGGKLTAPVNIIQNVIAARALYYKYRQEHLKRIQLYAQIEGLIAGNPPYNPAELARQGLGHIANFNNLDARSLYERGALAYWNLLNEAETLCKFEIRSDDMQSVKWADIMAKNWDHVVRQWPSFYTQVNTLSGQLIKFGISPVIWPDERDWRWRTIETQRFFISDQALTDVAQLTCVCVESSFTAQYLWEVYSEFKDKGQEASGWDVEELGKFLLYRANTHAKTEHQFNDVMDLQRRLQNGDIGYDAIFSDDVRVVSMLYKEYDGGISHYMFDRTYGGFLYRADKQYQTIEEALIIFTASPGEFTIHSNRGLGHKIFSGCQAMMQLDCSIVDAARWSSTPLIKTLTGTKDFEAIRFTPGVPTNIGAAEFLDNKMGSNIQQLVGASQYIMSKLQYNTANSGDDPGVPDANQGSVSPTEFKARAYKEFGVLKHNIAHFYSQFDFIIRNMTIKLLNSKKGYPGYEQAKEFKERCLEEGVPEQVLTGSDGYSMPRHLKVRATRVAGDGSTLARIMGLQELTAISGDFGPREAREYKRQWIMATMGTEYINAFLPDEEPDESTGGASLAGVENAVMRAGESPVFSPDNEQRAHIAVHFAVANDTVQKMQQQQMDAVAADKIFAVLIPHLGEHIDFASKSPFMQQFVEGIKKPWKQLMDFATMNRKAAANQIQAQIKKAQEDQQKTQQVMDEAQRKDFVAKADVARADYKVAEQVNRAKEANVTRGEVMKEKVQSDAEIKRMEVRLKADAEKGKEVSPPVNELRQDLANINGSTISPYDLEMTTNDKQRT